ncbi:MAG: ATP-dependent Clp protease ATP-binding subunit ClpX, partial [Cyanobacteria bacterium P01_F01_bin.42]
KKSMGFIQGAQKGVQKAKEKQSTESLKALEPDDLVKFGMIPEFTGRIPVTTVLNPLDESALCQILTEPRNALLKQYKKLLAMDDVALEFQPEAVQAIAKEAYRRKTGARALRAIVEEIMLDIMYELPSRKDMETCTITAEMVEQRSTAELLLHPSSIPTPESA